MKINHIDLGKHPILLAPMEDVTDPAFRLMCKKFGADMVYTEFVSSDALILAVYLNSDGTFFITDTCCQQDSAEVKHQ